MATYTATTLCKEFFAVNRPNKFEKELRKYGLRKENESDDGLWYQRKENKFMIYGYSSFELTNSESGEYLDVESVIQPFLKEGEKAAFIEVGNTKCMYDESNSFAVIITKYEVRYISLQDWVEEQIIDIRNKEFHPKIMQNE